MVPVPNSPPPKSLEKCCDTPLVWAPFEAIDHRGADAHCACCQNHYQSNATTGAIYVKAPDAEAFSHLACGETVQVVSRVHSIWERGTNAGYGEVRCEPIPFCPRCEEKPATRGAPVFYKQPVLTADGAVDLRASDGWEK